MSETIMIDNKTEVLINQIEVAYVTHISRSVLDGIYPRGIEAKATGLTSSGLTIEIDKVSLSPEEVTDLNSVLKRIGERVASEL